MRPVREVVGRRLRRGGGRWTHAESLSKRHVGSFFLSEWARGYWRSRGFGRIYISRASNVLAGSFPSARFESDPWTCFRDAAAYAERCELRGAVRETRRWLESVRRGVRFVENSILGFWKREWVQQTGVCVCVWRKLGPSCESLSLQIKSAESLPFAREYRSGSRPPSTSTTPKDTTSGWRARRLQRPT